MNPLPRLLLSLILVGMLLFCVFGVMATFEPLERSIQMTWRLVYATAGVVAVVALVLVNRRRRTPGD